MTKPQDDNMNEIVTQTAVELFARKLHGHAGEIAYLNGGGKLFENFVAGNPDYYVYRGECEHIAHNSRSIANDIRDTEHLIIVGQGPKLSLTSKEMQIIKKLRNLKQVTFIDVATEFNREAREVIEDFNKRSKRNIAVKTLTMDFHDAAKHVKRGMKTAVISTGSLISNVHNAPVHGFPDQIMIEMLNGFSMLAGPGGKVILGYDSNDDYTSLSKAYNQQLAPFIKNIMQIIADHSIGISKEFDPSPENFEYKMEWVKKGLQVSHTLVVKKPQSFTINYNGRVTPVTLDEGDEFVCISSIKPTPTKMSRLAPHANMETFNTYGSKDGLVTHIFSVLDHQNNNTPGNNNQAPAPAAA